MSNLLELTQDRDYKVLTRMMTFSHQSLHGCSVGHRASRKAERVTLRLINKFATLHSFPLRPHSAGELLRMYYGLAFFPIFFRG